MARLPAALRALEPATAPYPVHISEALARSRDALSRAYMPT
jgi:hypothetical protein